MDEDRDRESTQAIQDGLLDGIAVCWVKLNGTSGLMRDSFEALLAKLKHQTLTWLGLDAVGFRADWTDQELWELLKKRYQAEEDPNGVLNFKIAPTVLNQRRDSLQQKFPLMVGVIEKIVPTVVDL